MRPTLLLLPSLAILGCGGGGGSSDASAPDGGPDAVAFDAVRADAAPPDGRAAPVTKTFTVVSINLRHDEDQPERRFPLIADEIFRLDPDLVGMQEIEIGVGQTETLQGLLAERYGGTSPFTAYDELKVGLVGTATGEGIGILSKHPIVDMGYDDLRLAGRLQVWGRIDLGDGVVVDFYDTHLHNEGDAAERDAQAGRMLAGIDARDVGNAIVLTGDMNATPESALIDELDARLVDSYLAVHGEVDTAANGNTSSVILEEGHVDQNPTHRIDYVFGRDPVLGELVPTASEVVFKNHDEGGFYPSDHFGVVTTYELTVR